jgi:hypothetical protein
MTRTSQCVGSEGLGDETGGDELAQGESGGVQAVIALPDRSIEDPVELAAHRRGGVAGPTGDGVDGAVHSACAFVR